MSDAGAGGLPDPAAMDGMPPANGLPEDLPILTPGPYTDLDRAEVIRMVAGMIAHRNRTIASLLDRFEERSGLMYRERGPRRLSLLARELVAIADRIDRLAEDNAFDVQKLATWLTERQAAGLAETDTGHRGQVPYIQ